MISPSHILSYSFLAFTGLVSPLSAQITFSIDGGSAVPPFSSADLIGPGPALILKGSSIGVEVNAFPYGRHPIDAELGTPYFSVIPGSTGAPGSAVAAEFLKGGDEPADVYGAIIGSMTNF